MMGFKISHGTSNQYWLTVNNNPTAFAMLCENMRHTSKKDPELVAACRLIKAAPKLLALLQDLHQAGVWPEFHDRIEAVLTEARGEV